MAKEYSQIYGMVMELFEKLVQLLGPCRMDLAEYAELLDAGFIDTFRYFYPEQTGIYSWWSYRFSARAKNAGWRIDYFCVSESLKGRLDDAKILTDIMGSDHCPVELD